MRRGLIHGGVLLSALAGIVSVGVFALPSYTQQTSPPPSAPDTRPKKSDAKPRPASDENAFPEELSRQAADKTENSNAASQQSPNTADNGDDKDKGDKGAAPQKDQTAKPASAADENPFPEAVSQGAAKAPTTPNAGGKGPGEANPPPDAKPADSYSSSNPGGSSSGDMEPEALSPVTNQARALEDTKVGSFYMSTENFRGAYFRYKDAMAADPSNLNAILGAAEAAVRLKDYAEAERDYRMYLEIVPDGDKSKEVRKALAQLSLRGSSPQK